jgi:hypothetical protein
MPLAKRPQILDGDTVRAMNDAEFEQYQIDQTIAALDAQQEADCAALKADTLAKLGLTEAEVAALLS